nr:hypothetical protein [Tanacetum cinerariifolium]
RSDPVGGIDTEIVTRLVGQRRDARAGFAAPPRARPAPAKSDRQQKRRGDGELPRRLALPSPDGCDAHRRRD